MAKPTKTRALAITVLFDAVYSTSQQDISRHSSNKAQSNSNEKKNDSSNVWPYLETSIYIYFSLVWNVLKFFVKRLLC